MSSTLPREFTAAKIRRDAAAVITVSVLASVAVVSLTAGKFLKTFTPDGVAWNLPVVPQPATAEGLTLYTPEGPAPTTEVTGTLASLQVVVSEVNTMSLMYIGAALVIAALTGLVVIFCTGTLAWQLLRGQFFTSESSLTVRVLTWTTPLGVSLAYTAWNFGSNGIAAALGVRSTDTGGLVWWGWYAIILFVAVSFGLIDIALRRAVRLQHDQEGLV